MIDRQRNTFKYKGYDISVEADPESKSGISFLMPDRSIPGRSYFAFAYFDDVDRFIKCNCNWDDYEKAVKSEVNS